MATQTETQTTPRQSTDPKPLPPYHVVLLDDQFHTFNYVIEMLQKIFGHEKLKAQKMAKAVHESKRCIVFTGHLELAEMKRDQIHAAGADHRVANCAGSMSAVVEPA